jgi:capsular polysaccharide export protein
VVVKTHPSGRAHLRPDGVSDTIWITSPSHPGPLLTAARTVYTVTSQAGFEALLRRRPVRTFGMPFYAGWGLTGDDLAAPDRRGKASLPGLVHAALVAYPTYADPASGRLITPEEAIDLVAPPPPIADPSPRPCLRPPA